MSSLLRVQGRFGQRALLLTTAAVPLTGWAVHATVLLKQLARADKDPLTGLLRRNAYTARARRLLARRDDLAVVMVDADHFKAVNDTMGHRLGTPSSPRSAPDSPRGRAHERPSAASEATSSPSSSR